MNYGDIIMFYPPEEVMAFATLLMYARCKITMNTEVSIDFNYRTYN